MNEQLTFETLISVENLSNILGESQLIIFDCRFDLADTEVKRGDYLTSHIPGAFYAHLDENLSSPILPDTGRHPLPDVADLVGWLASCGFDGSQQVIVYDDSFGAMATRLWWLLKCLGHEAVAVLDGGWQAWLSAGKSTTADIPENIPAIYNPIFNMSEVITTDDVEVNLTRSQFMLVDVRANERFIGARELIDPVAGHIPGAINIPLTDNLAENGCYLSQQELKKLYQQVVNQQEDENLVFMCGSGVTACHSILAMVVAGFNRPKVYAGSWSEWIRNASRPVATDS